MQRESGSYLSDDLSSRVQDLRPRKFPEAIDLGPGHRIDGTEDREQRRFGSPLGAVFDLERDTEAHARHAGAVKAFSAHFGE